MARKLTMAKQSTIQTLHESGHSNREIAELIGVHRETVAKYVASAEQSADSIPAKPDHRVSDATNGPKNLCESFREIILAKLEQGLQGTRIHQDLRDDHGFTASYSSVRRFLQGLRKSEVIPVRRIETGPGEEVQVDFGTAAWVVDANGKRRRPWLFRVVLSHSRKGYSEVVWRQTTENFIACLENTIHYFGGAPKRLVIDNLKAAVAKADWYDPELHPKLQSFAQHYGTVILPTKPYKPEHKGKVESGVKYAKNNALKGRTFESLTSQNEFLLNWEQTTADNRIHGTTKKQVGKLFEDNERHALLPLPTDRFPCFKEARRSVNRDGHLEVDKAYYSAPPEYVGRRLWVRWDSHLVRIFNDRWESITVHAKAEPGRFRTAPEHIPKEKFSSVERGAKSMLERIALIGTHTSQWAQAMTQARGVEAVRVLVGLKALARKHSTEDLELACEKALAHGAYRLRTIRELIKRNSDKQQQQFDFIEHHPVIRPLSDYSLDSLHSFRKERL
jgi:transposase